MSMMRNVFGFTGQFKLEVWEETSPAVFEWVEITLPVRYSTLILKTMDYKPAISRFTGNRKSFENSNGIELIFSTNLIARGYLDVAKVRDLYLSINSLVDDEPKYRLSPTGDENDFSYEGYIELITKDQGFTTELNFIVRDKQDTLPPSLAYGSTTPPEFEPGGGGGGDPGAVYWDDILGKPSTFPPSPHNHNDLYYLKSEVDTLLTGYSPISHDHDTLYYRKTEIDPHFIITLTTETQYQKTGRFLENIWMIRATVLGESGKAIRWGSNVGDSSTGAGVMSYRDVSGGSQQGLRFEVADASSLNPAHVALEIDSATNAKFYGAVEVSGDLDMNGNDIVEGGKATFSNGYAFSILSEVTTVGNDISLQVPGLTDGDIIIKGSDGIEKGYLGFDATGMILKNESGTKYFTNLTGTTDIQMSGNLDVSGNIEATGIDHKFGVDTTVGTNIGSGYRINTHPTGLYLDHKVDDGESVHYRVGATGNSGASRTFMSVNGQTGNVSMSYDLDVSGQLTATSADINGVIESQGITNVGTFETTSILYHRNNILTLNKLENGWITWATRNASGTETVIDLSNIGQITAVNVNTSGLINGVDLTAAGSATNFLNEQGNYVTVSSGVDLGDSPTWTGVHTYGGSQETQIILKDPDNLLSVNAYNKVLQFTDSANVVAGEVGFNSNADKVFRLINEAATDFAFQNSGLNILTLSNSGTTTTLQAPSGDALTLNGSAGANFINITGSNTVSNLDLQVGNNSGDKNIDIKAGSGIGNSARFRLFRGGTEVTRISNFGSGTQFGINSGTTVFEWNTAGSVMTMSATLAMGSNPLTSNSYIESGEYTVASLPSASGAKKHIYVTDEAGGYTMAFSDGTNWRRVQDRAIVS